MPGSFLERAKQGSEWVGVTCAGSEGTGRCLCWERWCGGVGVCAGVCVGGVYMCVRMQVCVGCMCACAGIYVCVEGVCVWGCVWVCVCL